MTDDSAMDNNTMNETELLGGENNPTTWVSHPIDIRISMPFVRRRFYFTIVAGQERRRPDRRHADRQAYPLVTAGNIMFSLGITTMFILIALTMLVVQSAIIE
ncbi:MAG: hypothetical protein NUV50_13570 [Rhodospirillales bacterium]|nr:hypothetical protein [Rhodospirillales bacterium]